MRRALAAGSSGWADVGQRLHLSEMLAGQSSLGTASRTLAALSGEISTECFGIALKKGVSD